MREIKFRAWDKERKEMLGPERLCHFDGELSKGVQERSPFFEIMQYTGLKDKNGKEIFHKDFFKDSTGISIVEWHEKYASWCLRRNGWAFDHFFGEAVEPENGEVIGNIYENPELMEGK